MVTAIALIIAGFTLLIIGGEFLLRGAVAIATLAKLTPAVIGLTIVAAGTSVPELAVSFVAAVDGKTDICVGNVVGSNIFNITFILGLTALIRALSVSGNTVKLEYPVVAIVALLFIALGNDNLISRLDATLFIAIYVAFTVYLIHVVKKQISAKESLDIHQGVTELAIDEKPPNILLSSALTIGGIVLLGFGAEYTVSGAVSIGEFFGLSERIIGLTIVGAGTSLPEVVTSLIASYRGRNDVAIANILGSNLFNIVGILGITAMIAPLPVSREILSYDAWWMIGVTAILFPVMRSGYKITRLEGALFLGLYFGYLSTLIFSTH